MRAILITLFLTLTAFADRDLYTCEIVEGATIIGIWKTSDIAARNFKNPVKLLKGKVADFDGIKFRKDEFKYMLSLKKNQLMIAVRKYKNSCYVRQLDEKLSPEVNALLKQFDEMKKWPALTVEQQISKCSLIIKGQIKDSGEICPTWHFIKAEKALKGKLPKDISVYPVDQKILNNDRLLLLQKLPGNGPAYRVMKAVPLKEASKYLEKL